MRDLPDLTLLAPAQITIYNKKIVDHTVTADGISGNLADVYIFRFDRDSLIFCTRLLPAVRAGLLARFLLMGLGGWGARKEKFLCHV